MSSVDRVKFARDLASYSTSISSDTLRNAGLQPEQVNSIAGADHVISGEEEYGRLYDQLEALDRASSAEGGSGRRTGDLDRAGDVYRALLERNAAAAGPTAPAPAAPIPLTTGGSARTRSTGVMTPPRASPIAPDTAVVLLSRADYVRTLGNSTARELEPAARRNLTGPEASAVRRIRAQTDHVVERLQTLETSRAGTAAGSPERTRVDAQIESEVRAFEGMIASERTWLGQRARGNGSPSGPLGDITRALPPYLRESVEREGVVIPGVPGAVRPRTSSPFGADWKFRF